MAEGESPVVTANRLIAYHAPISKALTQERTSLESALIPVTAYIVVACAEAFLRYPDMMRRIEAAMPAEEIGRRARRPGCQVDTCYLWSISNFFLLGRKIMAMLDPAADDPADTALVLDFWERAAMAYRGDDGTRQAWDTGTSTPYDDDMVAALLAGVAPITDDDHRAHVKRFNATLVNHLFLMYFDTRAGYGDTGPYPVPGQPGRTLLVRDFYRLAQGDFPWSDVAAGVPYHHLTAALVLDDVQSTFTDFGTSNHTPEDYLDRLVGFALYTTDGLPPRELRLVPPDERDTIVAAVRAAQSQHYRNIAAMTRDEKIRAGAYVYFTFLRPFAEIAGVADELDWTVPRDLPEPVYEFMSAMQGENAGVPEDEAYYDPYPGALTMTDLKLTPADEKAHTPGDERLWGESWYFDFTNKEGTLGGYVRLGLYPNLGVAWYWACLVGEGRPLVTVIDHDVRIPKAPSLEIRAEGLWADHTVETPYEHMTLGCEAFAVGVDDASEVYGDLRGERVPFGFDLEWETDRGGVYPWIGTTRYEVSCNVHGEILIGDETIAFEGIGQRDHSWGVHDWWTIGWVWTAGWLEDGTRFHTARIRVPGLEAFAPGYVMRPDGPVEQIAVCTAEEELGDHGFPTTAHLVCGDLDLAVEPVSFSPVHLVDDDGGVVRLSRFPRALCRFEASDGRRGVGWTEWNQPMP